MPCALITGASRGIGRELACMLVSRGWQVLAAVREPLTAPAGTQAERVDMADPDSIRALARRLEARHAVLDALVNNAGVYQAPARRIWDVNLLGPLLLTRALEPLLAPGARVVMVGSGLGRMSSQPRELAQRLCAANLTLDDLEHMASEAPGGYAASKAAVSALARVFAERLRHRRILVNSISPGWVRTEMGGADAPRSVRQGAQSLLWGLQLPPDGPSGGAFEDGLPMD